MINTYNNFSYQYCAFISAVMASDLAANIQLQSYEPLYASLELLLYTNSTACKLPI